MKVTRKKRPDEIRCEFDGWNVYLDEGGDINITSRTNMYLYIHRDDDAKHLIEALQIILDSK